MSKKTCREFIMYQIVYINIIILLSSYILLCSCVFYCTLQEATNDGLIVKRHKLDL